MSLRVAPVGHKAALYAVEHWHYSKTLPVPPRVTLGVWENGTYIGVVIYSRGTSPAIGGPWGLMQSEICELTRVALNKHEAPVSQVVAASLRWLKEHNPGLRMVVSFADPHEGHHGGIYQAGNWLYVGDSTPTKAYKDKRTGKVWHSRQVSSTGYRTQFGQARRVVAIADCVAINLPGKHRYVMPLDKQMRRLASKAARPYPRRRGSGVSGDAPDFRSGEVGSIPTNRSTDEHDLDHDDDVALDSEAAAAVDALDAMLSPADG